MKSNTFSIIARCPGNRPARGGGGVCGTRRWLDVPFRPVERRRGVDAELGQSLSGADNVDELEKGAGADEALATALAEDEAGAFRQFGLVDASGVSAAHTGKECTSWAGQIFGIRRGRHRQYAHWPRSAGCNGRGFRCQRRRRTCRAPDVGSRSRRRRRVGIGAVSSPRLCGSMPMRSMRSSTSG